MSRRSLSILVFVVLVAGACTPAGDGGGDPSTSEAPDVATSTTSADAVPSFAGTVDAPDSPEGVEWVNTAQPISLVDLRGKVVLLDFWTYGCINCIHILPDLERLEAEFPGELIVIGVHSAKFPNEGETGNLEDIVQRYGIRHPVVNDRDFGIWSTWGATAWPTVAIVDPTGKIVGIRAGEGVYEAVEPVIAGLVAEFDAKQAMNREPITLALEADTAPDRPLRYPGKVLADGGRLWVSDTGHHRILEIDPVTGEVLAAFGSGERGADDGPASDATFNSPQGLAVAEGKLYVADTNNHLIRAIDLDTGAVTTVIGTGEQGWPPTSGPPRDVALASPWDLAWANGSLFIANAGTHQIWKATLAFDTVAPLIGSAIEGTANGPFASAELAQPSSVTLSGDGRLYFADSESSSIRYGDLSLGETFLLVGGDAGLFEFGDVDGAGNVARLQHPLGTAIDGDVLYVADTYNSKIKRIDLAAGSISSWLGGEPGWSDGTTPSFNEPGGLSVDGDTLYVADTNNHSIRLVDLSTGATSTLVLKGVEAFDQPARFAGEVVTLPSLPAGAGPASVLLDYRLPDGYIVNAEAPSSITIASGEPIVVFDSGGAVDLTGSDLPVSVPITLREGTGTARFDVTIIYCSDEAKDLCLIDRVRYEQPLDVGPAGSSAQIVLSRTIAAPG
jgi:sugar lactone lactonase YvrE